MRARVLIIEDDHDIRTFLAEMLEEHGYDVEPVSSFAAFRVSGSAIAFDAVLADFLVDTRDVEQSWAIYDELVEMVWPTPILMVSGWRLGQAELERHGVLSNVEKPVSMRVLLDWIETAVATRDVTSDERRLVREYFERLAARQWTEFAALCTEDVTYRLPGPDNRFACTVAGRAMLEAFTEATFRDFQGVRYDTHEIVARPGYLTIEYRSTWTAGGAELAGHGTVLLKLREGAIAGIAVRFDPNSVVVVHQLPFVD